MKNLPREFLVDDGHFRRGERVVLVEIAPRHKGRPHRLKITRAGAVEQQIDARAGGALSPYVLVPAGAAHGSHGHLSGGDRPGTFHSRASVCLRTSVIRAEG